MSVQGCSPDILVGLSAGLNPPESKTTSRKGLFCDALWAHGRLPRLFILGNSWDFLGHQFWQVGVLGVAYYARTGCGVDKNLRVSGACEGSR